MRRLLRRLRSSTSALTTRLGGTNVLVFTTGLGLIAASAFTVSVGLGLLVTGILMVGGTLAYERGGPSAPGGDDR